MLTLDLLSMSLVCIIIASDVLMRGAVASSNMCGCAHRFPILMELYHSASGSLWSANSGWGSPATECSQDWYGVDCTGNDVRSVNLAGNNLIGSLPPSWGNLTGLSSLYLHSNQLSGSLPESWGSLPSLQTLTLYNNSIRGSLPLSWGGMAAIIDLHLHANNIEGGLPDDWASLGATLTTLFLFSNKIDGTLPASWHNMTNLKNLQLQSNGLSGSLPSAWSSMSSLEILNLYENILTGTLPDAWGNMSNMMAMYVKGNYLSGTLPESWSSLRKITDFQLNYNNLVGTLPSSWSSMTELTLLTMHYNSLTGTLPSSWGHMMVKLTSLSLQNNQLNGTIPESWVTGMTALRQLYLSFNELSGTIPSVSWSAMTNLATLHIESNQLVGTLPPSLGALGATSMLKQLFLQDNCLSGMIATGSYSTFAAVAVSSDADGMNTCSTRLRRTPSTVSVCGGDAKSTWPAFCFWIVSRSSSITTATSSLTRNVSKSVSGSQSRRRNTDTASISTSSSTSSSASGSRTTTPSSSSTSTPPTSTSTHDSSATTHDSSGTAMSLSFSHSWPQSQTVNTHTKSTTSGRDKSMTSSQWHSTTSPSDLEATTPHSTTASTTSLLNSSHTLAMPTLTCFPNLGSTVTMSLATTTSLTHDGSGDEVVALISSVNIFQHTIANSDGGVPLSVEFTALPVARATLVDLPKFVLNISKHDRFSTMSSTMFWRTSGVVHVASSLLSTNLNWSTVEVGESTTTEEVEGGEGGASWQVLRVSPPTSGWLDAATTSPVLDRTVSLVVTMACAASDQAVNNTVARISISIPAPGVARQLASEVKAAGGYSQIASVLAGGASSGSALGRVMATRSIVLCDAASSVSGGVIDFGVHLCRGDRNDAARSALVSNISLITAVVCAFLAAAVLWAHGTGSSLRVAARNFCFPSSLMPVWMAVLPSSTAGATLLISELGSTLCTGTDVVLVVIGIAISATPALSIAALWYLRARGPDAVLLCVQHPYVVTPPPVNDEHLPLVEQFLLTVKHLVRRAVQRSWKWRAITRKTNAVDGRNSITSRVPRMEYEWVVLLEYRVLLYGVVDTGILALVSSAAVISGLHVSQIQCRYWSLAIVLLLALQLGTLVVLRPLTTVFSTVHSGATLILTSLSMSFQLAYLWRQSTSSSSGGGGSESGLWMVNAAAVCDLAVVGVTAVKMLLDLLQLCAAVRRRAVALQDLHARQQNYHKDSLDVVDAVNCSADFDARKSNAPPSHMTMESHESFGVSAQVLAEVLQQADEKFWDSAGIARSSHRQGVGHEDAEVNDSFTAYSLEEGGRLPMDASPWGEQHEIGTSNERQKEHQYDALLFS